MRGERHSGCPRKYPNPYATNFCVGRLPTVPTVGEAMEDRGDGYGKIAAEVRAKADTMADDRAKHAMIEAAESWERLAALAERRTPPRRKHRIDGGLTLISSDGLAVRTGRAQYVDVHSGRSARRRDWPPAVPLPDLMRRNNCSDDTTQSAAESLE